MSSYSEAIADYILKLSYDQIPNEVVQKTKQIIIDTLGVMILGAETPWSQMILRCFQEQGGSPEASVIYHGVPLPASSAAFVNGTMAHSFDYDDDLAACHIACCVISSALAVAQKTSASGKELITAVVIGYDVTVRLAETLDGHHLYAIGFHPTSVCGTFGAVAAASRLLHLTRKQVVHALGIAGSFPSGSLEWLQDGSMTKRFHGGKSAYEGILAARLAEKGFSGPRLIFEGNNGLFKMFQAQRQYHLLVNELSQRYDILKSYIKLYPCCTCNAPIVDAVLEIKKETEFHLSEIANITVRVRKTCLPLVGEPLHKKQTPQTILDAQMSAPYCVAVALLEGEVLPSQFSLNRIEDQNISRLAKKVEVVWDPQLDVEGNPRPVPAEVILKLVNGSIIKKKIDYQKGTYRRPLTTTELQKKLSKCVEGKLPEKNLQALMDRIDNLEKLVDIDQLLRLTVGRIGGDRDGI